MGTWMCIKMDILFLLLFKILGVHNYSSVKFLILSFSIARESCKLSSSTWWSVACHLKGLHYYFFKNHFLTQRWLWLNSHHHSCISDYNAIDHGWLTTGKLAKHAKQIHKVLVQHRPWRTQIQRIVFQVLTLVLVNAVISFWKHFPKIPGSIRLGKT